MKRRSAIIILLALLVLFIYKYFDLGEVLSFERIQAERDALRSTVEASPVLSGVLFAVIYFLVVVTSIPFATVLTLLGGFLFGSLWGTVLVVISATFGSVVTFMLARWLFHDWFFNRFSGRLVTMLHKFKEDAFTHLLVLRLIPIFPFFLVNIAPAFTDMTVRQYFFATFLGIIPASFVYAHAGRELGSINSVGDIASPGVLGAFVLLALLAILPVAYKKHVARKLVMHDEVDTSHDTM